MTYLKRAILLLLLAQCLTPGLALSQSSINELVVPVTYPDGTTPVEGAYVEILDATDDSYVGGTISDSSGNAYLYSVDAEKSYVFKVKPCSSNMGAQNGLYLDAEYTRFLSLSDSEYDSGLLRYTAPVLTLTNATRFLQVQLDDGTNPLAGITVNAYENSTYETTYCGTVTDGSGIATIRIPNNDEGEWGISTSSSSYGNLQFQRAVPAGSGSVTVQRSLRSANSALNFSLVQGDGTTSFTVPSDSYPSLSCEEQGGEVAESLFLVSGDVGGVMSVPAGSYQCSGWFDGFFTDSVVVIASSGGSQSINFKIQAPDSTITLPLLTSSGSPYSFPSSGSEGSISCNDSTREYWNYYPLQGGDSSVSFSVLSGTYECSGNIDGNSFPIGSVTVVAGETASVPVTIPDLSATLTLSLLNKSDSTPYVPSSSENFSFSCYDEATTFSFYDTYDVGESAITRSISPGTYSCSVSYFDFYISEKVTIGESETKNISFLLPALNSQIRILFRQSDGSTPYLLPDTTDDSTYSGAYCYSEDLSLNVQLVEGTSEATLNLSSGSYICGVSILGMTLDIGSLTLAEGEGREATVVVPDLTATVHMNLKHGNTGEAFVFPSEPNIYGSTYCRKSDGSLSRDVSLAAGESSKDIALPEGRYECGIWFDQYASESKEVTLVSGSNVDLSISLFDKDSSVPIHIVDDRSGELVSGTSFEVYANIPWEFGSSTRLEDFAYDSTDTGSVTFSLVSSQQYELGISSATTSSESSALNTILSESGFNYFLPRTVQKIRPIPGSNQPVEVRLKRTSSAVEITAFNSDGSFIKQGYVDAFVPFAFDGESPDSSEGESISTGTQIVDGKARLPLLPDVEYEIMIFSFQEDQSQKILPPASQRVTLKDGETRELSFSMVQANYDLSVSAQYPASAELGNLSEEATFFGCGAFNESGQHSFFDDQSGQASGILPLFVAKKPRRWSVYCYGVSGSSPNEKFYFGNTSFLPKQGTTSGEVSVTLQEEEDFFSEELIRFDVAQDQTLTLPDEKGVVEIPAQALANSGIGLMRVKSGVGYTFSETDFPLTTYDISFEVDGRSITETQRPVKIHFSLRKEDLEKIGVSIEDAKAGSFDTNIRSWKEDALYSYDADREILTITVSHFSLWGVLIDKSNSKKREAPTKLRARKIGKKNDKKRLYRYKISWKGPESDIDERFEVDMLTVKTKKKRKKKRKARAQSDLDWSQAETTEVIGTKYRTRLRRGKKLYLRVRLQDGVNSKEKKIVVK